MFAELALACFLQVDGSASRSWKLLRLEYHQTKLADLAKFCMSIFKDFATIFFFGKKNCQQTKCRAKISPILVFKFENSCAIMQRKSVWSLYNRKNAKNNQNSYFPKMIKSNLKTFKKVKESSNKNPKQKRPNTFLLAKWERIIKKKTVKYHKYIKNIFFFFAKNMADPCLTLARDSIHCCLSPQFWLCNWQPTLEELDVEYVPRQTSRIYNL